MIPGTTSTTGRAREAVERCALPGADPATAVPALAAVLVEDGHCATDEAARVAPPLIELCRHYGNEPFTPLEEVRRRLGTDKGAFGRLLELSRRVPELGAAVLAGPAGKYWSNTVLPLEEAGALQAALTGTPALPHILGLYPGPTCMFRCHFCVRVTGARYAASALDEGNAVLASVIDEMPTHNPHALYVSGGLEPLTNPGLGALVARAASRGFRMTLYTNAFSLTAQTLGRQPGLWDLDAVRTSLYGLDDAEYEATTGKKGAFTRVRDNLLAFQRLRSAQGHPVRLGLNHIVLPGRAHRLLGLVDFIAELDAGAPDRPVDFLNLREDYSGRPDGRLTERERSELRDVLHAFEEKAARLTPTLRVDLGYALHGLKAGAGAVLPRIRPEDMRPAGHLPVAAQIDLLGDVYLYREAGFPGLAGAERYVAGRVGPGTTLREVAERFASGPGVDPRPGDEYFMDGFDQVVAARLNQMAADTAAGWGDRRGFLNTRPPAPADSPRTSLAPHLDTKGGT
ncbi:dTDP-4-amino-4,6-dideoxy-D-glucose ammonia-lyase [Streptomyces sp. NPDC006235]|uniref:dTDP-4-amino-4,6-dideoxy-D-glucose ammonia-lyase n=1 Tax=Streptomyces sp. NPDC006235 TaxID=3156736 RepID=UPI0033ABD0F8